MKKIAYIALTALATLVMASCSSGGKIVTGNYTLTLEGIGGTFSDGNTTKTLSKVSQITDSSVLETPSRSATETTTYTFNGWYDGKTSSSNPISFPYTLTKDTTFYANWKENPIQTYTVTLKANGGTFSDGNNEAVIKNASKIKKSDIANYTPTYENHVFLGWYYSTTSYNDEVDFPLTVKQDISLYAMWGEGEGYTINLSPEGGTFSDGETNTKQLTNQYKVSYNDLDVPTKVNDEGQNYTFLGWSKDKSSLCLGNEILRNDISLYAIYRDPSSDTFTIYPSEGGTVAKEGNIYKITSAGTYMIEGNLKEGQVYIDAGDDSEVNIILNGATITSNQLIPFYVKNASKVKIKAQVNTLNYVYDNRVINEEEESVGGAIYSKCDLDFVGKGYLQVESTANNGIHCTKDLDIKNLTLYVKGLDNGIKGNNSITIESGDISVVAISGDGLKTSENDLTSKGKQKGDITITGGKIDIDAYGDGIQAAHDVTIEPGIDDDGNETIPDIDIKTNKYADTGGTPVTKETLYIRSTIDLRKYSNVFVYSYNNDGSNDTQTATYQGTEEVEEGGGMGPGGGPRRTTYYLWSLPRPTAFTNLKLYIGQSTSSYTYYTDGKTYNSSYNMITLGSSFSSSKLSFSWGIHDSSNDLSAKGIKSENMITINNSTINIKSFGNAIHAKSSSIIESTSTYGVGTININNGAINIYTDDKGVHGDNYLNMNGGTVTVSSSYEGFEASVITINGGTTHIYATDDGFNAGSKDSTITNKQININGGYVDIQVGDGDTDGIDSNGTYTQKGGIVISRASNNNRMSTGLDTDGQSTISDSGVFITLGIEPEALTERRMSYNKTTSGSVSFSSNSTHTINDTYSFTVKTSYSKYFAYLGSNATAPTIK